MTKYTPVTEVSAVECVTPPCISAPIQEVQKSPVEILVVNLVPQANQTQPTPPVTLQPVNHPSQHHQAVHPPMSWSNRVSISPTYSKVN
ncbi:hypothetical protein DSO57_1039145 [Entomophthora muscae]|uniref:Uncharacterized protein n=1 Tax=Entomophthora muscae TaxID=34485 RepID=A0ACC2RD78_9FUNG|nr:hypothetical protein DSO57_1039145 [Entomophthora muscae]